VFEGYDYNSQDKLRKNQLEWGLKIPMAQAAGNPQSIISNFRPKRFKNYQ
jgi:hypothetical protein